MLSPFMTVAVLAVLWLIVVVPMVLRRSDERRRERSVDGFRPRDARARAAARGTPSRTRRAEVFVPRQTRAPLAAPRPAVPCPPPRRR